LGLKRAKRKKMDDIRKERNFSNEIRTATARNTEIKYMNLVQKTNFKESQHPRFQ